MAVDWKLAEVREFFGKFEHERHEGGVVWFLYDGSLLKYELFIDEGKEWIGIGGDDSLPFGADSMLEVYVPCNVIRIGGDPYHPEQKLLRFYYGDPKEAQSLRLELLKKPNGDLKVWPVYPNPEGHALR